MGGFTPFELRHKPVIFIVIICCYTAPLFTRDSDDSILYSKYILGIRIAPTVLKKRVPAIQVLSVKQFYGRITRLSQAYEFWYS